MKIDYQCPDGSRTFAKWPSIALMYWLGRAYPHKSIENPEPFKIYITSSPVPSDTNPMFLTLLYAECERRWNKSPPFEIVPVGETLEQPKEDRFRFPPGGAEYQSRCLDILRWLHEQGDIVTLKVETDEES